MSDEKENKPVKDYRYGGVELSVWENARDDGEKYFSASMKKRYKTDDGEWRDASSLLAGDLLNAAKACEDAYTWIRHAERAMRDAREQEER